MDGRVANPKVQRRSIQWSPAPPKPQQRPDVNEYASERNMEHHLNDSLIEGEDEKVNDFDDE